MFGFGLGQTSSDDAVQRVKTFVASTGGYDAFTPAFHSNDTEGLTTSVRLLVESISYVRNKEMAIVTTTDTTAVTILKSQISEGKQAVRGMWTGLYKTWDNAIINVDRGDVEQIGTMRFLYNLINSVIPSLVLSPSELQGRTIRAVPRPELSGLSISPFAGEPLLWFPNLSSGTQQAATIAQASLDSLAAKINSMRSQLAAARNALDQEKALLAQLIQKAKELGIVIS